MQEIKRGILIRSRIILLFFIVLSFVIACRIFYIQTILGVRLRQYVKKINYVEREIQPKRGNILDCNGNLLAVSLPFYKLSIDPHNLTESDFLIKIPQLAKDLSELFGDKNTDDYYQIIYKSYKKKKRYVLLNNKEINNSQRDIVLGWEFFNPKSKNQIGLLEKKEIRFKPFKELASRTIGYVAANNSGVGIEYSFNRFLSGMPGRGLFKKISHNIWTAVESVNNEPPIDGYDVESTIDINLQDIVHSTMINVLLSCNAEYGCAIVMDVSTGEIRAMVNLNRTTDSGYKEQYNYCIGNHGVREPGSVFKIISLMALLEFGNISLDDIVDCRNGVEFFYDKKLTEASGRKFKEITIREVFEQSSNIGTAKLAIATFDANPKQFIDFIKFLCIDKTSGIALHGEGTPYIPTTEDKKWSGISLPWLSIGYGVELSPIKILQIFNAIANNGVMLKPLIVKYIKNGNKIIKTFRPEVVVSKICSDKTLEHVKSVLEGVVERGTAKQFRGSFYKIAGKSGTANVISKGRYTSDTYVTFVGYFPSDKPRYSCIVSMSCPKSYNWHFGGKLAYVVKTIADKLVSQDLQVNNYEVNKKTDNTAGITTLINKSDILTIATKLNLKVIDNSKDTSIVKASILNNVIQISNP